MIKCSINKETGGIVQVKKSLEASCYGPSETPVCYLTEGIIKAAAEKIVGKPAEVKERKCTAMGNGYCEFAVIVEARPLTEEELSARGLITRKEARLTEEKLIQS